MKRTINCLLTYDVMGNISTLNRDNTGANAYSYSGNRLSSVAGLTVQAYQYDANGNATLDGRSGMALSYTMLNLPATASKPGVSVAYTYDAAGRKLAKNSNGTLRQYVDGIEYNGNAIDIIHTEEGVAQNSGGTYSYHYNLSDHLGNVRYSFDIYNGAVRRLQADDYYSFGKRRSVSPVGLDNKYLYNGKEVQDELGEQYDYGARFYDPVIARFNTVDPLAELGRRWSVYNYTFNNPIKFTDPDGMFPEELSKKQKKDDENFHLPPLHDSPWSPSNIDDGNQEWRKLRIDLNSKSSKQFENMYIAGGDEEGPKPKLKTKSSKKVDEHAQELEEYGKVVNVFVLSGTISVGFGGTGEFGYIVTDKNYVQYFYTVYYTNTVAAGLGANLGGVVSKKGKQTAISDWAGISYGGSINYGYFSGFYGTSSTYSAAGGGIGAGLSFKKWASGSLGYTTLVGSPILIKASPSQITKSYLNIMQSQGGL